MSQSGRKIDFPGFQTGELAVLQQQPMEKCRSGSVISNDEDRISCVQVFEIRKENPIKYITCPDIKIPDREGEKQEYQNKYPFR